MSEAQPGEQATERSPAEPSPEEVIEASEAVCEATELPDCESISVTSEG